MYSLYDKFFRIKNQSSVVPASPLMQTIIDAVRPVAGNGTVPALCMEGKLDHSQIEIVSGSESVYRLIVREIKNAKRQILIQAFHWEPNTPVVQDIKQALCGISPDHEIDFFLLVDQLSPVARFFFHGEFPPKFSKHDPKSLGLDGLPGNVKLHIGTYKHTFAANHNKAIVIDDKVILTGVNFQTENYGPNQFHDGGIFIPSDAAEAPFFDFYAMWELRTNKAEEDIRPVSLNFRAKESAHSCVSLFVTNTLRQWPAALPFYQAPLPKDPLNNTYITAINNAKSTIRIIVPNLNTPEIMDALVNFINTRNGKLELLMGENFNDMRESFYGGTNQYAVDNMLSKIDVDKRNNLDIRWFNRESTGDTKDIIHMKFMAIDDQIVIYGSANLDLVSLHNSHEANMVIDSSDFALRITAAFFTPNFVTAKKATATLRSDPHENDVATHSGPY